MGLDITAYSEFTVVDRYLDERSRGYQFACMEFANDDLRWDAYFAPRKRGEFALYEWSKENRPCSVGMAYSTYSRVRRIISTAILNQTDEQVWRQEPDATRGVFSLVHFTDCDGIMHGELCTRIYDELRDGEAAFVSLVSVASDRDDLVYWYQQIKHVFDAAGSTGLVVFH